MKKLQQELEILNKRRMEVQNQIREEVSKIALPKFEKLIGKYFKFENSYSGDNEWFEYLHITGIVEDSVRLAYDDEPMCELECIRFAKDSYGKINFDMKDTIYKHSLGEEISEEEFRHAYEDLKKEIFI